MATKTEEGGKSRAELIKQVEKARNSKVICFLTSLRPGVVGNIADDQVRVLFDHLLALPHRPEPKLDLFLASNGGNGVVPWRVVSLLREFAKEFRVIIPYRAYSAATLIALGADEIVMHPFGELGPIDPSVTNDFNPKNPQNQASLPISVEDVKAYVHFIKRTVGITHEDELVRTIEILCNQVHPLALGNVERFVSQSRMVATKVLKTHMTNDNDHIIEEVVENMTSKLYFHGHPINRSEAKNDLKLKIGDCSRELERMIWDLYLDFESNEMQGLVPFNPVGEMQAQAGATVAPGIVTQREFHLVHATIQSLELKSSYETNRRVVMTITPQGQPQFQEHLLSQGWSHSKG